MLQSLFAKGAKEERPFRYLSRQDLDRLQAPPCQRIADPLHVQSIYTFQKRHRQSYGEFFFALPVVIARLDSSDYIVDGQHRIACARLLHEDGEKVDLFARIIRVNTMEELEEKYEVLNRNKPVPKGPLREWTSFVKPVEQHFRRVFAKFLSPSENPRAPNFNVLQLSEYLRKYDIASRFDSDAQAFLKRAEELNTYYSRTYETSLIPNFREKARLTKQIALAQKKRPPCFLGLFRKFEWVARVVYSEDQKVTFAAMDHFPLEPCGKKIEKRLRREVWDVRHASALKGSCYVCETELDYDTFVCGHWKSRFFGGATTRSNLRPLCIVCNQDMGVEDMEDYGHRLRRRLR